MSATGLHTFDRAVQTANTWLIEVSRTMEDDDRQHAYRTIRAWLHTLRDRLPVDIAANFGAQLPVLLRGIYYEGWDPSDTPVKYDREAYINRFAYEAAVPEAGVEKAARAVSTTVLRHTSPGQLDEVLKALPHDLRPILEPVA